ncbi:MAG: hypothetical protein COA77_09470 [Thaumarchaeota archaeon]|nr:MAG: hypothetical protein COA77_09470 [Nitrososphaerota archaeon]
MSGIYFVRHNPYKNRNIYKIGFSSDIKSRLCNYNTMALPCDRFTVNKVITSEYYMNNIGELRYLERTCHNILRKYRLFNTELFEIDDFKEVFNELICDLSDNNINVTVYDNINPLFKRKFSKPENKLNFDYQIPKVAKLRKYFESNDTGMLVYPPGWGKTYIAGQIFKDYRNVVVFVSQILVANEFSKMCKAYGLKCEIINSDHISGNDMKMIQNGDIKIINYQSYQKCKDRLINVDLIIYDEAHHIYAEKFSETLKLPSNKKLFLTATPKIVDEFDIKIPIIDRESIRDSIKKGRLCDYRIVTFKETSLLETINKLINVHGRKKIIVFFNKKSIGDLERKSKTFSRILNENNIRSYDMHGDLSKTKKDKIMTAFCEEGPRVICNVNMISEGVSIPCADCILFAESRSSSIGVVQNIGRVLRRHLDKDISLICLPPSMLDAISILNIMYHTDPYIRKNKNMFISDNMKELNKTFVRIKNNKSGGLWEHKYQIAIEYENTGKIIDSKTKYKKVNLGSWIAQNKKKYYIDQLSKDKIILLCKLTKFNKWHNNMKQKRDDIIFKEWTQACKNYEQSFNKLIVLSTTFGEYNIGKWLTGVKPTNSKQLKMLKTIKSYKNLITAKKSNTKKVKSLQKYFDSISK